MTRRASTWVGGLAALVAVDLAATIHSYATWKKAPGGPSVMTLAQLLGFASSAALLIITIMVVVGGISSGRQRRGGRG